VKIVSSVLYFELFVNAFVFFFLGKKQEATLKVLPKEFRIHCSSMGLQLLINECFMWERGLHKSRVVVSIAF
jgi:hypothetical protein